MIHKRRFESDKGDLPSPNIPGLSKVPVECSKQDNPEDAEEKNSCVTNSVICAPRFAASAATAFPMPLDPPVICHKIKMDVS